MSDTLRREAEELFQEAVDLPPEERPLFLQDRCSGSEKLQAEVESLLECLENSRITSLDNADRSDEMEPDLTGKQVGAYKIQELIGEGGFGSVYLAEQEEPIRRKVALKIIKLGMDTREVIARFEAERQALAMMDHPNIARVFDAGATDTGRPYFVMELVRGVPITEFCDTKDLDLQERLQLFQQVCHAVQHAHQKGIIHRDLKPSNVLVSPNNGSSLPKVIDFGIAKATGKRLTGYTILTEFLQLIGTPEYMSPEQAGMDGLDIDTRTDIYSLGVLLYVLLTGRTPFEAQSLRRIALGEIQRIICEVDPPTPSQRASKLGADLKEVARHRSLQPQHLSRTIRGDLDWIVMKALEKDRNRRYETASALAADIRRHLNNEPVLAGPPSRAYKIRKFVRRHRVGVLAGLLTAAALVAGLSLATWGFFQATRAKADLQVERDAAESARSGEQAQRELAEFHAEEASHQTTKFKAVNDFLEEMMASADPRQALGRKITMGYVLDEASLKIEEGCFQDQPEVEATVRMTLGKTYRGLGLYPGALKQYEAAEKIRSELLQGKDDEEKLSLYRSRAAVAGVLREMGRYGEAEKIFRKTLEAHRQILGPENCETLLTMHGLGISLWRQDQYTEAEKIHRHVHASQCRLLGEDHPDAIRSLTSIGTVLWGQKRIGEAEKALSEALERGERILGEDHPDVQAARNNLGLVLEARNRYTKAEDLFRRSLEVDLRVLGPAHPRTQIPLNNLLRILKIQGKTEESRPYVKVQMKNRQNIAEDPQATPTALNDYAWLLLTCEPKDLRNPKAALPIAERALELDGGKDANILDTLAMAYHLNGELDKAVDAQEKAVALALPGTRYNRDELEERLFKYLLEKGDVLGISQIAWGRLARDMNEKKMSEIKPLPPRQKP